MRVVFSVKSRFLIKKSFSMQVVFFNEIKFSHESSFSMQIVFFFNESKFSMQGGFKKKNESRFSVPMIFQYK
jgi:hypothetical protein